MKRLNQPVGWGLFLLLAGIFLLLWNLGVMDPWGDLAWGVLYALAGLGFLIWFATEVGRWWRAIPAFTLLSIGAMIILGWRGVNLGEWRAPIVLFGMALGGWLSGAIFDLTGSYDAAFVNGIAWNLLNVAIVLWLLARQRRSGALRPLAFG